MTIQTVINNKNSMILCTDIRQTIDDYKSYIGVKKIFEIKENTPYGIMINGLMEFEGVPLETLIGEFKQNLNEFDDIKKIKNRLITFLGESTPHTSTDDYLTEVLEPFKIRLNESIEEDGFKYAIDNKSFTLIPTFVKEYSNFDSEFHDLIPEGYDEEEYNLKIWRIFSHELNFEGSQIILAGYNKKHHYGSLFVFNIYYNNYGEIILKETESIENCDEPYIRVYAMNEEAYAFITGVSSDFEEYIKSHIRDTDEEILMNMEWYLKDNDFENYKDILEVLKKELNNKFFDLIQTIDTFKIDMLEDTSYSCEYVPRQLLCDFADSLIKLTALKQKLSLDLETVSSESDMALITKTGNFKWIKYNEEIVQIQLKTIKK